MKNLKVTRVAIFMLMVCFSSFSLVAQEEVEEVTTEMEEVLQESITIQGVFDGMEGDSYSFNYKNEDDEEDTVFFDKINPNVLKSYNLKDKKFVGKTFDVIYETIEEPEVDEDGDTQYNRQRTIVSLKLITE